MSNYSTTRESGEAAQRARQFLEKSDQFRLGELVTESSHPRDRDLSDTAAKNAAEGLRLLFDVDRDVIDTFEKWSRSEAPERIAGEVVDVLRKGGKLFFAGCGSTGRLSIQLVSIWRRYWRELKDSGQIDPKEAVTWENRAWSVMAGGDFALIKSVEGFEDYTDFGKRHIDELGVGESDAVFGITEGGETSFVIGATWKGVERGAKAYFVYNNPDDILRNTVERSGEILKEPRIEKINLTTGPMAITGSTRMQATSIQLAAMLTILELALHDISAELTRKEPAPATEIIQSIRDELKGTHANLLDAGFREQLVKLSQTEETIYQNKLRNNYFADRLAIDVLTDTTERSPTFSIPAFKKTGDDEAAESWSFLYLPYHDSETAWKELLQREPVTVEWDRATIATMVEEKDLDRQEAVVREIDRDALLRFQIGMDGLHQRPFRQGDGGTAILTTQDLPALFEKEGFFRTQLEHAHEQGAATCVVFIGPAGKVREVETFLQNWQVPALPVLFPIPESRSALNPALRVGIKMLLNALSTLTMVRMGRVLENFMIWVVPSNLKLIDRSTRYIQHLTGLNYEEACYRLHEAMEYVRPRLTAGKEYPSVVGLAVTSVKEDCAFEEAERRLQNPPQSAE